jgi:hypothetical protein
MTSRTWFWKVAVSVLALAAAWYEFYPIAPTPLEDFVPTQVIKDKPAFEKIHAEAKKRLRDYKDAAVPADQKSVSYSQALRAAWTSCRSSTTRRISSANPISRSETSWS